MADHVGPFFSKELVRALDFFFTGLLDCVGCVRKRGLSTSSSDRLLFTSGQRAPTHCASTDGNASTAWRVMMAIFEPNPRWAGVLS